MKTTKIYWCLLVLLFACTKKETSTFPTKTDITESVYASGRVKAAEQYNVYATVNGILKKISVKESDLVKNGQILFELDNIAPQLNADNARLALSLSEENNKKNSDRIRELETNINLTRDKYKLDSSLFDKQKKLWAQNVGSEVDFEQRKIAFESSKNNYLIAINRLAQVKTQLQNEQSRAAVNYNISQQNLSNFSIVSIMDGKIYDILREKGELITPQTPLAVIGQADVFVLELEIDENDVSKVEVGQKLAVTMDSYPNQVFEAVINKIFPIINERSRTFSAEASFTVAPKKLFPNLTLEANIIIQTKANAITIPKIYLVENEFVWLGKDKKKVKIGLNDYQKVEILEGLSEKDEIFLKK